jgi:hypothetical protein
VQTPASCSDGEGGWYVNFESGARPLSVHIPLQLFVTRDQRTIFVSSNNFARKIAHSKVLVVEHALRRAGLAAGPFRFPACTIRTGKEETKAVRDEEGGEGA